MPPFIDELGATLSDQLRYGAPSKPESSSESQKLSVLYRPT